MIQNIANQKKSWTLDLLLIWCNYSSCLGEEERGGKSSKRKYFVKCSLRSDWIVYLCVCGMCVSLEKWEVWWKGVIILKRAGLSTFQLWYATKSHFFKRTLFFQSFYLSQLYISHFHFWILLHIILIVKPLETEIKILELKRGQNKIKTTNVVKWNVRILNMFKTSLSSGW